MNKIVTEVILDIYNYKLEDEEFEFLSNFTILWGIFEKKFREKEKSLSCERIETVINSNEFKYIKDNSKSFNSLPEIILTEFNSNDFLVSFSYVDFKISLFPTEIKIGLKNLQKCFSVNNDIIEKSNPKIILLISFIAFRLRNNLFHGNKVFSELHQQKSLFEIINNFLAEILIKTKDIKIVV